MKRIVLLALTVVPMASPEGRGAPSIRPATAFRRATDRQSTTKVSAIRRLRIATFAKTSTGPALRGAPMVLQGVSRLRDPGIGVWHFGSS